MHFSHRLILLWLAHAKLAKKKTGASKKHSRCRKDFFRSLSIKAAVSAIEKSHDVL